MAVGAEPRAPPELLPKHSISLSHSGKQKPFVEQLCEYLERENHYPFFDQNSDSLPKGEGYPDLIFAAAKQCQVAVIVLSDDFMTSKWPMQELITIMKSKRTPQVGKGNPKLKIVPLFYKLAPNDLKDKAKVDRWREAWKKMGGNHKVDEQDCVDAIALLGKVNGLIIEKYGNSDLRYMRGVVDTICEVLPPALPFDTSHIHGRDRLCKAISSMFVDKGGCQYLGLYGMAGLGKSTICCDAMGHYFQKESHLRYCLVEMESGKASDGKAAADKKREDRLRHAIEHLVGSHKSMANMQSIFQLQKHLTVRLSRDRPRPVFLVVDGVEERSEEEAKWYVNVGLASGSKVLVTSRSREILEVVLGGSQYCQPIPTMEEEEASDLFLSKAAPCRSQSISLSPLDHTEREILQYCVSKCFLDGRYHPLALTALAIYLLDKAKDENIFRWQGSLEAENVLDSREAEDIFHILGLGYEDLDKMTKLIFLDLTIFAAGMCHTHIDFHEELEWDEHSNFKQVVSFIAMLHKISEEKAVAKVKELQRMSLFSESSTEISVPAIYKEFALWLVDRDGKEKKWCMFCRPKDGDSAYLPSVFPSGLERVILQDICLYDGDLPGIREWRNVVFLQLVNVKNLPVLNLQGLLSLRVLWVMECDDMEQIDVRKCNSSHGGGFLCYRNQRQCGCMPELRVVQLEFLPKLKNALFPMHCWNLETLWFFGCPNLGSMPDLRFCNKLKKFRLPCGDFTGFQGLSSNHALTELAFQWDPETIVNFTPDMRNRLLDDVMNLTNLTILDIQDERKAYEWIPKGIRGLNVSKLGCLTFLDLSYATTIKEVEGLEQLSQLTSLSLYGCCELRKLPNTVLKILKRLCIGHCHKLALTEDAVKMLQEADCVDYSFHGFGESCSFGEHECLDPKDREGSCKVCPEDSEGEQDQATEKPGNQVAEVCPRRQSSSEKVNAGPRVGYPVSMSEKNVDEEVLSTIPAAQELQDDTSGNSLNILLLGETGVGKSTFINALCNYLTFHTLDEALDKARDGEMQSLIYSEFITADDDYEERKIAVGIPDDDEGASSKEVGSSCTQKCKAYTFPIGEKRLIRLIDTPGIGDTRGFDQDVKNIKDMLSYISRYEVLNAICILLKPNEERLTTSLKYCIVELLAHLHKDASSNLLFCFTNIRSTMYKVGSSRNLLQGLLAQSPETASIKLNKSTMYLFDSEGFRFLASVHNGINFSDDETESFRRSWRISTDEASRLIQNIASLTPHDIQSTLSLNRVRDMLATIEVPLAETSANIQKNLDEVRQVMKDLTEGHSCLKDQIELLVIKENVQQLFPLGYLRTICYRPSCKDVICHENCQPTETVVGSVVGYFRGADDTQQSVFCNRLSLRTGECRACHCPNDAHIRVSQVSRTVFREREDASIRSVIEKTNSDIEKKQEISKILEQRAESGKAEMMVVVNAAALFAGYLAQNSIITYHAATKEYLIEQIKMKKRCDDLNTPEGKARIAELECLLDTYEREVQNFQSRSSSGRSLGKVKRISQEDLQDEFNKLYALKANGDTLRSWVDDFKKDYKRRAIRREEVACNIPHVTINQAAYTAKRDAGPKSLIEKLKGLKINGHKKDAGRR